MIDYTTIAESNNFIVLDKYIKEWKVAESYQSEYDLEREFVQDLQNQGYEYPTWPTACPKKRAGQPQRRLKL
jgi:type I restriction enzyme R subunit